MKTPSFSYARLAHKSVACLLAFCMVNLPVWALNAGDAAVSAGTANITAPAANTVSVELITNRAVLDWTQMNATNSETLNFSRAGGFAVLNRVASAVDFNGTLNGQGGRVYILSPSIILGPDARIKADTFTAAAMNMTNQNFMDGIDKFEPFAGGSGSVTNYANITGGPDGVTQQVNLLGKTIVNEGVISLPSGGIAVMAAGEKIYLGEPGGKVIVEMTGVKDGQVVNNGTINAPNGKIILAAGDIYSIPLHPQYQVGEIPDGELDYSVPADKAVIDAQPIIAESGDGAVVQSGTIHADGGEVILTAGDDVLVESGSETSARDGKFTAYANDFGNFDSQTIFEDGAAVYVDGGKAQFYGNHLLYAGDTITQPGAKLFIGSEELTIADVMLGGVPALDTVYEEMVEYYSKQGVDLDLAGDIQLTVKYMADGQISGGSGDIYLRNIFEDGGIYFERQYEDAATPSGPRTAIHTTAHYVSSTEYRDGGSIYMDSGASGIVAGNLITDTISPDKVSQPGEIMLRSSNGGDIEVDMMKANGAYDTQVSAISSGDLIVHGDAISENKQVDNVQQIVSRAILCLVAEGDVILEGQNYKVTSHGKQETTADIRISAGDDVYVGSAAISAEAKTSEAKSVTKSTALVVVRAGTAQDDPGEIIINGVTYTAGQSFLPDGRLYAKAWPGPFAIDSSETPASTSGSETTWQQSGTPAEKFFVRIDVDNNAAAPCSDCPVPPGLPPVPHIFWLVNDEFETSWRSGNVSGFDPETLDVLLNDGLTSDPTVTLITDVSFETAKGGMLTLVQIEDPDTHQLYWAFDYTPPTDQPFVWDGTSDYATFTDTFEYQAQKEIKGSMVLSKNKATVEIAVTNFLPILADSSDTIHMSTAGNPTSLGFDLSNLVVDSDGTPGTINYGVVEGLIPVANGSLATDSSVVPDTLAISGDVITYSPLDGYVSPTDSPTTFGYSVVDSSILSAPETPLEQTADLRVTVTNALPGGDVVLEDAHMNAVGETVGVVSGSLTDPDGDAILEEVITPATDDYNKSYGGTLVDNGDDTFTYTADSRLPGYTGEDDFDASLWDGQMNYYIDGSSEKVYGTGNIDLNITNDLPGGDVWLGTTNMDSGITNGSIVSGSFTNGDGILSVEVTGRSSEDYNHSYGGDLVANSDGTYDYTPDALLPGYTGDKVDNFDDAGYVISQNADDRFDVRLWNGEYDYSDFNFEETGGKGENNLAKVYGQGTVSVDITNTPPTVTDSQAIAHMNTVIQGQLGASDTTDAITIVPGSPVSEFGIGVTLTTNPDGTISYTYTPADGYVGADSFDFSATDGERNYVFSSEGAIVSDELVTVSGKVSLELTNIKPTAQGDLGEVTTPDPIPQNGITSPVQVTDTFDPQQTTPDTLSIVPGTYTGNQGGTLLFDGAAWTYTPAEGFTGQETFTVNVWDGQNVYEQGQKVASDYGTGTVLVSVTSETPEVPVPPLPVLRLPQLKGCPALMDAAASELAINSDELQLLLSNSLAENPNMQPCDACEQLVDASAILKDPDGQRMAALAQIFNTLAPADAPLTPEVQASVATAFADVTNQDAQYALASDYVDAFAKYIAVVQRDLKMPVGDPVALVLQKYGTAISESTNPNIAAYITAQMTANGSL